MAGKRASGQTDSRRVFGQVPNRQIRCVPASTPASPPTTSKRSLVETQFFQPVLDTEETSTGLPPCLTRLD
jgi:hypothetical protein